MAKATPMSPPRREAAWRAGLTAIICIGETEAQREAGEHNHICASQIDGSVPAGATAANTVIAYEPVWAIGTGKTPTTRRHRRHACPYPRLPGASGWAKARARQMRILYGGSVKADNAAQILNLPEVDGALVGGASLKAEDFLQHYRQRESPLNQVSRHFLKTPARILAA